MSKILKILISAIVVSLAIFIELSLLISDYGIGETPMTRLVTMISLMIFTGCLLWLLFSKGRKLIVFLILIGAIFVFLISIILPNFIYKQD